MLTWILFTIIIITIIIIIIIICLTSSAYFEFYTNYVWSSWITKFISNLSQLQNVSNPYAVIKIYIKERRTFSRSEKETRNWIFAEN